MRNIGSPFSAFLAFLLVAGTLHAAEEESYRFPPDLAERMKTIRTIAMIRPDIKMFELSTGGVKELRQEWCDECCMKVQAAFVDQFQRFGYDIKILDLAEDNSADLREILFLYGTWSRASSGTLTRVPNSFPRRRRTSTTPWGRSTTCCSRPGRTHCC